MTEEPAPYHARGAAKRGKKRPMNTSVYLSPKEHKLISEAADLQRQTLSGFIATAALREAHRVHEMQPVQRRTVEP